MSKQRILFVITQGGWGGAQRYVYDLAARLDRTRFEVVVATGASAAGELVERLRAASIPVHLLQYLERSFNPITNLLFTLELRTLVKKLMPRVVHVNSTNAGVFGALAAVGVRPRPRLVYTAHGFPFGEPGFFRSRTFLLAERLAAPFRDRTICVSRHDYDAAVRIRICPREKLVYIPNGVDARELNFVPRAAARRELVPKLTADHILVGTISQSYPMKGLRHLVKAAALLAPEHPELRFALVDRGPEQALLRRRIRAAGIADRFTFIPYRTDGARYLKAFDIVTAPSLKEGLPYLVIEAALAERAIVASAVGGVPEIIEHRASGLLMPAGDASALARAIAELAGAPEARRAFGASVARTARLRFRVDAMVSATTALYEKLID